MPPDERRTALIDATLPLLLVHGRATTTRQIAQAAGVAEGTIFRVFPTKEELFDAAVARTFDPDDLIASINDIDRAQPMRSRLIDLATLLQVRVSAIFALMSRMAMTEVPTAGSADPEWLDRAGAAMLALVQADADAFRMEPSEALRILRMLTFSGSHPHLSEGSLLPPETIVDVILSGTLRQGPGQSSGGGR